MKKSRNITIPAIFIAIAFIFLYASSILPSAKLASLAISTACICVIVIECGKCTGLLAGGVLSILSWLFVPDKTVSILFILFFSYYPVIKLLAEQNTRLREWIIKILYFFSITLISLLILKLTRLIPKSVLSLFDGAMITTLAVTTIVFIQCVFDYALSMIIGFYMRRIKGKF